MSNPYQQLLDFQAAFGQNIGAHPVLPDAFERKLRRKLLREEFNEYLDAEEEHDLVEIADALADIIYIAYGTGVSYGLPMDKIFDEVHRSNMSKLNPETGKPDLNEYGKVKKPASYSPADIVSIIDQHLPQNK